MKEYFHNLHLLLFQEQNSTQEQAPDYSDYFVTQESTASEASGGQNEQAAMSYDILREQHRMRDRMPLVPKSGYSQPPSAASERPQQPSDSQGQGQPTIFDQQPPFEARNRSGAGTSKNKYGDEGFE